MSDKPHDPRKNQSFNIQHLLSQVLVLDQQGDQDKAEELYQKAILLASEQPDDLCLLGETSLQMGNLDRALTFLQQTIDADPNHANACASMGGVLFSLGQFAESIDCYRQYIALTPVSSGSPLATKVSQIHYNLGNAQFSMGHPEEAVVSYETALSLNPNHADALYNLSLAHRHSGNEAEAAICLEKAIKIAPDYAEAHNNLGNVYLALERLEDAIKCYEKAVLIKPGFADAHNNLGNAYGGAGRLEDAVSQYEAAIELHPDRALTYFNLGVVYGKLHDTDKAVACYETAIRLNPTEADAYANLGIIQLDREELIHTCESFENVLRIRPDDFSANDALAFVFQRLGQIDESIDHHRKAVELRPAKPSAYNNLIYALQFHPEITGDDLLKETLKWDTLFSVPIGDADYPNKPEAERRLRIGYVSADFREHAVSYFLERIIAGHDRENIEVFCYGEVANPDAVTDRFMGHADVWRSTVGMTDDEMGTMIRDDRIDIIVECSGRTASNRLHALLQKPAPLQVNFLAMHGETSGLRCMDYVLSDRDITPPGYEHQFSEDLLLLDHGSFIFQADASWPDVAPPRREDATPIYACVAAPDRISDTVIALWAQLLDRVPDAQFLFKHPYYDDPKTRGLWRQKLAPLGERVVLEGVEGGWARHMDVYGRVDVVLDTYPMTGATSCLIPFWMGVPVLMLTAPFYGHRIGISVLTNADQSAFIFEDVDLYLKAAVDLVHDHDRLAVLRNELRQQIMNAPICDAQSRIRDIETAYRKIWRKWCSGQG